MPIKYRIFLLSFSLFLVSCIERFEPKLTPSKQRLVVESHLTTELKTQEVLLTLDAPYTSTDNIFKDRVMKAQVEMTDDAGNRYKFVEDNTGENELSIKQGFYYRSEQPFAAQIGRKYTLHITTVTGQKYESDAELIRPVSAIQSATYQLFNNPVGSRYAGHFKVYVESNDPAADRNFYLWNYTHIKQLTYCREWYIYGSGGSVTQSFVDKCCEQCFGIERCKSCFELENDRLINGNKIQKKQVATVPLDSKSNYYLRINQYSLSENAYRYWQGLKQNSSNTGGLFDVTPQPLVGNIHAVADPTEEVLGYFTVSDVKYKILIIDRKNTGIQFQEPELYTTYQKTTQCFPCMELYNRTKKLPEGWVN